MKTITINGKEYKMEMTGTVGITLTANSIVPAEERMVEVGKNEDGTPKLVPSDNYVCALLYAVLLASNPEAMDEVDILTFRNHLTYKLLAELSAWFNERFDELEGRMAATDKPEAKGRKKK